MNYLCQMKKICVSILLCMIFLPVLSQARKEGILPFTGLQYTENGIYAKKIEVDLEENHWISNQLPVESTFEVKLMNPRGFSMDSTGNYHPNIKLTIVDTAGDTVGHSDKFMGDSPLLSSFELDKLSLSLAFKAGTPLGEYTIFAKFYDELSSASLDIKLDVELVDQPYSNFTTNWYNSYTSFTGYNIETIKAELSGIKCYRDTIKYNNTVAVFLEIFEIAIPSQQMKQGKSILTVYDNDRNVIPLEKLKYPPSITLDYTPTANYNPNSSLNIVVVFPQSEDIQNYFIRWQWQSQDGKEKIDFVGKIN